MADFMRYLPLSQGDRARESDVSSDWRDATADVIDRAAVLLEAAARVAGYWVSTANIDSSDAGSIADGLAHHAAQGIEGLVVIAPQVRVFETIAELSIDVPYVTMQSTRHPTSRCSRWRPSSPRRGPPPRSRRCSRPDRTACSTPRARRSSAIGS